MTSQIRDTGGQVDFSPLTTYYFLLTTQFLIARNTIKNRRNSFRLNKNAVSNRPKMRTFRARSDAFRRRLRQLAPELQRENLIATAWN